MLQPRYNHDDQPLEGWGEEDGAKSIITDSTQATDASKKQEAPSQKRKEVTKSGAKKAGAKSGTAPGKGGNPMYVTKQKKKKKEKPAMTSSLPQDGKIPKVNHFVKNPNANQTPSFYERFIRNREVLNK
jgi:hypothetical protein